VDPLINVRSVTHHLIQKENLRSILNILNIEGKVVVGNNDAKNIKENMITPRSNSSLNISDKN
jgi:precorrin-3B methylase